jgi:hypothetical protein
MKLVNHSIIGQKIWTDTYLSRQALLTAYQIECEPEILEISANVKLSISFTIF